MEIPSGCGGFVFGDFHAASHPPLYRIIQFRDEPLVYFRVLVFYELVHFQNPALTYPVFSPGKALAGEVELRVFLIVGVDRGSMIDSDVNVN
ncbi:MAG: hypothetical protein P8011_09670 [Acidihalobacter sp.]|jgi:hypothetical protein|uniref:hypothetical protein n=1 Tax=Acidihalobacter sp. TaxID=1872108 RepID=UPI00307D8801